MMKKLQNLFYLSFISLMLFSCTKDEVAENKPVDPAQVVENEVKRFIYRGLNDYYLYKADVPVLGNNYFSSVSERNDYLEAAGSPEDLFDALKAPQDEFSFMFADYIALENLFKGVSKTNGMDLGLGVFSNSDGVFAYVRYVLPGSPAEEAGIKRGDFFTTVDGTQMNLDNYSDLIGQETYTITLATISDNTISQTNEKVTLTKVVYNENPVHITRVIETGGKKIGYLMYNSFTANYDDILNDAFAEFQSAGVTDLVLDLRYNGGGSVLTATRLASMITGQFTGEVFMKEQWNKKWQAIFQEQRPEWLVNKFTDTIDAGQPLNSLFLDQVYVLATGSSASASELILNGL
ncbi:MAG TPA: S41 family peptidase, partial [Salinimicrobium sp.]|nr:S41 family peptidase [Salinimicrobium sp.]